MVSVLLEVLLVPYSSHPFYESYSSNMDTGGHLYLSYYLSNYIPFPRLSPLAQLPYKIHSTREGKCISRVNTLRNT